MKTARLSRDLLFAIAVGACIIAIAIPLGLVRGVPPEVWAADILVIAIWLHAEVTAPRV